MDNKNIPDSETLVKLLEATEKDAKYSRRMAAASMGIFIVLAIIAVVLIPSAAATMAEARKTLVQAQESLENINGQMDSIANMIASVTKTSDNVNSMVEDNYQALAESVEKMNDIDFEGLNKAIKDFQDAISPLAGLNRGLGGLFG